MCRCARRTAARKTSGSSSGMLPARTSGKPRGCPDTRGLRSSRPRSASISCSNAAAALLRDSKYVAAVVIPNDRRRHAHCLCDRDTTGLLPAEVLARSAAPVHRRETRTSRRWNGDRVRDRVRCMLVRTTSRRELARKSPGPGCPRGAWSCQSALERQRFAGKREKDVEATEAGGPPRLSSRNG